ncbi:DLP12 prophage [Escherichia coli]|nr:DLP12 prophage [Escherichia coli]
MADLRKAARGRECQVRIPGVCNGNPETSVLAHIRLTGLCGTGTKPPDLIATIACSACHDEIDRRTHLSMLHMQKNARWKVWREHRLSG